MQVIIKHESWTLHYEVNVEAGFAKLEHAILPNGAESADAFNVLRNDHALGIKAYRIGQIKALTSAFEATVISLFDGTKFTG